jgi:hypothetical protein
MSATLWCIAELKRNHSAAQLKTRNQNGLMNLAKHLPPAWSFIWPSPAIETREKGQYVDRWMAG